MPDTITFEDPNGVEKPIDLDIATVPKDLPDRLLREAHIPELDPYYDDL